ncbi:MAG: FecR domain-containing protein [Pseudomonadota bacterium]|nr:FecR domain-containing protein [Pseudomonadota bacterium]
MSLFPTARARIRREAAAWVARLAENAGTAEHAAFRQWRDADPRHAEAYDRIAGIWNQAGRASRSPAADASRMVRPAERPQMLGFALAASLAFAVLVSVLLLGSRWLPGAGPEQEPMIFAAAVGEIKEIKLPDGSRLVLDSGSRIEAVFTGAERRLILKEGRARFQVAHETRPFAVRAGSSEVLATGTLFDVSLIGGRTAVLLLEGSVEVSTVDDRRMTERLKPGQKLIVPASGPPERRPVTRGDTGWIAGMIEFDDMRLADAAALANRYSKVQLKLDEQVGDLRVSGAFRTGDVAGLASSLAAAFELRLVRLPNGNLLLAHADPGERAPTS